MCGRFAISTVDEIADRFEIEGSVPELEPNYNAAPSQTVATVTKNSPNTIVRMKWGFIPKWANPAKSKFKPINARADKLNGNFYKSAFLNSRCLVPANGFYEWKTLNTEDKEEKIPYYIHLKDQKLFGFAGIYSVHTDAEGEKHHFVAIITTNSNSFMKKIHHRMPVIIHKKDEEKWLTKGTDINELKKLIQPYESSKMEAWRVDKRVGNARNNDKDLLKPVKN